MLLAPGLYSHPKYIKYNYRRNSNIAREKLSIKMIFKEIKKILKKSCFEMIIG